MSRESALASFHPRVAAWFGQRMGEPTEIQSLAWPRIAAGEHLLVSAPTGSGKTLTAFLWAIDQLLTGAWSGGRVRVLYISPLRALNNDIQRNLLAPLAELERQLVESGEAVQPVRVATRSGDTTGAERRRMFKQPPEILITTPESLNILLTSKSGRRILQDLTCVVLDEIHAVAASKRGVHLITAVERLTLLSGEFQRLALSATVEPPERIARFVGGWSMEDPVGGGEPVYRPRQVGIVASTATKVYDLEVVFSQVVEAAAEASAEVPGSDSPDSGSPDSGWEPVVRGIRRRIRDNRSTLVFANSRRTTEKLTRFLNEGEAGDLAYSHHGSLSREIRAVVEERLKAGRLQAIVATNSLELGIDIGALDEVVMVQTPPTVASAIQRLGRAGHAVGAVSRGRLFPLVDRDLLDAAVVAASVLGQDIEEVRPVEGALDVLAQVILSMIAAESWDRDELLAFLRSSYPYRRLTPRQLDLVIEMLAGRYANGRIRELNPRIRVDRVENRLEARPGAARLIYLSGGTIPDRGYFHLRVHDSMAKIGELDEEFVWERSVGDTFTLGAQAWRIRAVTHNDVLVTPAHRGSAMAPFWRAEERNRSFHLSDRIGRFLEVAEGHLRDADGAASLARLLGERHCFDAASAAALTDLLERQRAAAGGHLPHRHHLLVERVAEGGSDDGRRQVVLHTFWGGRVLRPFALALAAAWEKEHGWPLELEHDNDCLALALPAEVESARIFELVRSDNAEELLRERLESTGFFGARFRESAGRALLLPRKSFRRRIPLWLNRQRSKKLLATVRELEDFPILAETWRTCLEDEFELTSLVAVLSELERGEIRWSEVDTSSPSPFAAGVFWRRTNRLMYEDDRPEEGGASSLSRDLLRELVHSSQLRPRFPAVLLDRFQRKLHRTFPGYAPRSAEELTDWVVERVAIPDDEWQELTAAMARDQGPEAAGLGEILETAARQVVRLELPGDPSRSPAAVICALEAIPRLARALKIPRPRLILRPLFAVSDRPVPENTMRRLARLWELEDERASSQGSEDPLADLVSEWLRFYGPVSRERLTTTFGLDEAAATGLLEGLVEEERLVIDQFREGPDEGAPEDGELELCDAENLERLLRLLRAAVRPSFEALPLDRLPLFLADRQGLVSGAGDPEALKESLEGLFGYVAPVGLWESELLPARLDPYYTSWLDALFQETDLVWFGAGRERVGFSLGGDVELYLGEEDGEEDRGDEEGVGFDEIFGGPAGTEAGRFEELVRRTGVGTAELARELWRLAWEGRVSNTTFLALRQAALARFEPADIEPAASGREARRQRRSGSRRRPFERWRASRPWPGDWYSLAAVGPQDAEPLDALDEEELNRDRVRVLLRRYGVLFRELLQRELPGLQWSRLFRTLRILELSGEVLAGRFFEDIPGLQFAAPGALRRLREGLPEDAVFWLSAADPASPSGLGLDALRGTLPSRLGSSHLVYHGSRLVVISRRHGGELEVRPGPEHPDLSRYFGFLKVLLTRQFQPRRVVAVETINELPAARSPYLSTLGEMFALTREEPGVKLRRRY